MGVDVSGPIDVSAEGEAFNHVSQGRRVFEGGVWIKSGAFVGVLLEEGVLDMALGK